MRTWEGIEANKWTWRQTDRQTDENRAMRAERTGQRENRRSRTGEQIDAENRERERDAGEPVLLYAAHTCCTWQRQVM